MKSNKEKSKLIRFLSNPLFGSISVIITIVSIILAIFFYSEGKSKRELKYYCHPVKATVVKTGQTSSLEVFCENEKIESDVTAVQVAIWNRGKKPIKRDDILEPIVLYTEPNTSIIDAVVRKQTREVTNLSIDRNSFKEGFIPVSWRILEHNDGGIIQIIFTGGPDVEILAKGTIEGQRSIKKIKSLIKALSPIKSLRMRYESIRIIGFLMLFSGALLILTYHGIKNRKLIEGDEKIIRLINFSPRIFTILTIILLFIGSIICLFVAREMQPPFGF